MKLKRLCDAAGIECPEARQNDEVQAIATNSNQVIEQSMFVCIRGLRTDGHVFANAAVDAGAKWIVCESDCDIDRREGITYLLTGDTRRTAAYLYDAWYGFPCRSLSMIGVTGTNGKSSVTHMIAHILEKNGKRCGLIGTLGSYLGAQRLTDTSDDPLANMTTPDPAALYRVLSEMVRNGAQYAVMEVSSHALALGRVAPIEFDVGVFTNLTPEHLDFHETMENYAKAKAALFTKSKISIINANSQYAEQMRAAAGEHDTCSVNARNGDFVASEIRLFGGAGVSYRLATPNGEASVISPIGGMFTVENTLLAIAAASAVGIDPTCAAHALASLQGVRGRMERVALSDADFSVLIDYAHTPDALENLLRCAKGMQKKGKRVVLLFGCGGDRDRSKRPVMGRIASEFADHVILTSDNSRTEDKKTILRAVLDGISLDTPCTVICDRREAIRYAILTAQKDDLILLAGKGHEEYEIDADGRRYFSEKEIVKEAFLERQRTMEGER